MDNLGRYYTNYLFSELLVQHIEINNPATVLDLGAGGGALLKAAFNRWNSAAYIAADIDRHSLLSLTSSMPLVRVYHANGLKINIEKNIDLKKSSIDVAICNPPYLKVRDKTRFNSLLSDSNLIECLGLKKLTSDIVFLAQNLKLLKDGGELGIILPDSILTGQEFQVLRSSLLINHNVKCVIELPDRIFPRTEAKTHIIMIEKSGSVNTKIPLLIAGKNGQCYDQIDVNSTELINRMDFSYHKFKITQAKNKTQKLGSLKVELKRGTLTNGTAKESGIKCLHSTSFKNGNELYLVNKNKVAFRNSVLAEKGDLVLVRVGRGCVGKVALIKRGKITYYRSLYTSFKLNS